MIDAIFKPIEDSTVTVAAGSTSNHVGVASTCRAVRVFNYGANVAFVRVGVGTATASAINTPVLPGSQLTLPKYVGEDRLAYISANGTTLMIESGNVLLVGGAWQPNN